MIVHQPLARDFTVVPNALLRDPALSMDAKAVHAWLLSRPRDWIGCVKQLCKHWACGLERMKRIMRELTDAGWARRCPPRKGAGGAYTRGDYIVFNTRQPVQAKLALDPAAEAPTADTSAPRAVQPESVEPESGGPESHLRTPNQERIPPRTDSLPPNPPVARGVPAPSKTVSGDGGGGDVPPDPAPGGTGPGRRAGRRPAAAALSPEAAGRFRELVAAYPEGALRSRERDAQAAFAALPPAEQAAAVVRARSYAESLRRKPGHVFALQTWLRQTDFRALAERLAAPAPAERPAAPPPPDPRPAAPRAPERPAADPSSESWAMAARGDWPRGGGVFVAADSPEGAAWAAHFARFGRPAIWVSVPGKGRGLPMPGLWPPAAEAA